MSKKKITIKPASDLRNYEEIVDAWVNDKPIVPQNEPLNLQNTVAEESRFTIVIPTFLHRRIKKKCAIEGLSMKEMLIQILTNAFPES